MVRFVCSLVIVACFAWSARADIAPPPPDKGFKRVPFEHVVKLEGEIPGYKFYTFRGAVFGDASIGEELQLGTGKSIAVKSSSSPSVRTGVVAVPEKVLAEIKLENLGKYLARQSKEKLPTGVVMHDTRGTSRDLKDSDPRSKVENVITISADAKAGVKFTTKETPAPSGKDGASNDSARPQIATMMAGISASLALVMIGVWCFRGGQTSDADQSN